MVSRGSPEFSVVIPTLGTRNGALKRAVRSAQEQSQTRVEVLVVDDATPDDSVRVLALEAGVGYLRRRVNGGPSAARNEGARLASGRFIVFLDSDDELPESRPWVGTPWGVTVGRIYREGRLDMPASPLDLPSSLLRHKGGASLSSLVLCRELLLEEPFDVSLRAWEDWDLVYRLSLRRVPVTASEACFAIIHEDSPDRLSRSPSMQSSLSILYAKYHSQIRQDATAQAVWCRKLGQRHLLAGDRWSGRAWILKSLVRRPFSPRRWWMVISGRVPSAKR